jgi:hypothetical protein
MISKRKSFNGCVYVWTEDRKELEAYCKRHKINPAWIRFRAKTNRYYLRLWGRYK